MAHSYTSLRQHGSQLHTITSTWLTDTHHYVNMAHNYTTLRQHDSQLHTITSTRLTATHHYVNMAHSYTPLRQHDSQLHTITSTWLTTTHHHVNTAHSHTPLRQHGSQLHTITSTRLTATHHYVPLIHAAHRQALSGRINVTTGSSINISCVNHTTTDHQGCTHLYFTMCTKTRLVIEIINRLTAVQITDTNYNTPQDHSRPQ